MWKLLLVWPPAENHSPREPGQKALVALHSTSAFPDSATPTWDLVSQVSQGNEGTYLRAEHKRKCFSASPSDTRPCTNGSLRTHPWTSPDIDLRHTHVLRAHV